MMGELSFLVSMFISLNFYFHNKLWHAAFLFSFISNYFLIPHVISSVNPLVVLKGFSFHICEFSSFPSVIELQFNSIVMEKEIVCMSSVCLNLLRLVLLPNIWFVLENVAHISEKKLSSVVRCNVLCMCQFWFIYSVVKSQMSLLMFCRAIQSITENGVLNSPTITVGLFLLQFCQCLLLLFGGSVIWCICFQILFLDELTLLSLYNELFCLLKQV